jgi:amidase
MRAGPQSPLCCARMSGVMLTMALTIGGTSCSPLTYKQAATPPPHAFISYRAPAPGDKNLKLGVKDLIDMKGEVTSAGSEHFFKNGTPAAKDADCLRIIRQRKDVTIVGKTNLSEFAVGVSGSNDYFGTPYNPVDKTRVPGGSSSGSASAVGLGLADVALGTDTAGSIRVPAACCGVAGLKTTFGLISTKGVYPISPNYLDTVGPISKNVSGLVTGMELLQDGFGAKYANAKAAKPTAQQIRIGRLRMPGTDRAIDRAIDARLAARGFQVVELDDAFLKQWLKAQEHGALVAAAASWYNNQKIENAQGIENRARKAFFVGDIIFSRRYKDEDKRKAAIAERDAFVAMLNQKFTEVDAIVLPVISKPPLKLNRHFTGIFEAKFMSIQCTMAPSYAGIPALALPVPMEGSDFPVTSMQIAGPANSEAALLNIGRLAE